MQKVRIADKLAAFQEQREVQVMLIAPTSTLNTGKVRNERTVDVLETL